MPCNRSALFVTLIFAALGLGCHGMQGVKDYCAEQGNCPACTTDADCEIVSNSCHEFATCAPKAANLSVNQIGCSIEYDVPSDDVCRCVEKVCSSTTADR